MKGVYQCNKLINFSLIKKSIILFHYIILSGNKVPFLDNNNAIHQESLLKIMINQFDIFMAHPYFLKSKEEMQHITLKYFAFLSNFYLIRFKLIFM